jgi:hypothetical protein
MADVLEALKTIQLSQARLASEVESVSHRLDSLAPSAQDTDLEGSGKVLPRDAATVTASSGAPTPLGSTTEPDDTAPTTATSVAVQAQKSGFTSRIILTTYPKQNGIHPLPLDWGAPDAARRGPVVVSRSSSTIRRRNAIGAHGGSYSIYFALALASKQLNANHRPDFTNTEPAVNIGPFPQWSDKKKIVAMDPWGHLAPWLFADTIEKENVDIRPTIAITKAHMKARMCPRMVRLKFLLTPNSYPSLRRVFEAVDCMSRYL